MYEEFKNKLQYTEEYIKWLSDKFHLPTTQTSNIAVSAYRSSVTNLNELASKWAIIIKALLSYSLWAIDNNDNILKDIRRIEIVHNVKFDDAIKDGCIAHKLIVNVTSNVVYAEYPGATYTIDNRQYKVFNCNSNIYLIVTQIYAIDSAIEHFVAMCIDNGFEVVSDDLLNAFIEPRIQSYEYKQIIYDDYTFINKVISELDKYKDEYTEYVYNVTNATLNQLSEYTKDVSSQYKSTLDDINAKYTALINALTELEKNKHRALEAYMRSMTEGQHILAPAVDIIRRYMDKGIVKSIKLIEKKLYVSISSCIKYWDEKDFQCFLNGKYFDEGIERVMIALFGPQPTAKYHTNTTIGIDIAGTVISGNSVIPYVNPNPHLGWYGCTGSVRPSLISAFNDYDFEKFACLLLTVVDQINFCDYTVVKEFIRRNLADNTVKCIEYKDSFYTGVEFVNLLTKEAKENEAHNDD